MQINISSKDVRTFGGFSLFVAENNINISECDLVASGEFSFAIRYLIRKKRWQTAPLIGSKYKGGALASQSSWRPDVTIQEAGRLSFASWRLWWAGSVGPFWLGL